MQCHYLWIPEVVNHFKDDRQIRRNTAKGLFRKLIRQNGIKCIKKGHSSCRNYFKWKTLHPQEFQSIKEKCENCPKSVYIPNPAIVSLDGQKVEVEGGIKSLDPPCLSLAYTAGEHPFTCKNCHEQLRDLKNLIRKRTKATYEIERNKTRVGLKGFRNGYAKHGEELKALKQSQSAKKESEEKSNALIKELNKPQKWTDLLLQSCLNGDEAKLVEDLVKLLQAGVSESKPIQITVIRNLVSKLKSKNNTKYVEIIKDLSAVHKNRLGLKNYALLADIFGLPSGTTVCQRAKCISMNPGINMDAIERAIVEYEGVPVIECSDEARALRYLEPRLNRSGTLELIGTSWNPDVSTWGNQVLKLPRVDVEKGDVDEFSALKRLVDDLIESDSLAKDVSLHNFTALCSNEKPDIAYCIWPTPNSGYKSKHLLKFLERLRWLCFYKENGSPRKIPLALLGFSTDSAGFSLHASVTSMTPTELHVKEGVFFLRLGIPEERFAAPYYSNLPFISFLDWDHERRLFAKCLKYETLDLTLWKGTKGKSSWITIQHLKQLKDVCEKKGIVCGFSSLDLELGKFFDQNSDAADRMFTLRIADLLDQYVPGSQGTSLFIRAVYCIIEPFRDLQFGSPSQVQRSVSKGITIFRLWKKVLELKKLRIRATKGAKSDPKKRGHFLTYGCETTAEVLFAAATLYNLAMFLHFPHHGPSWSSPRNAGTRATERMISELQGKTNQIQSLNAQPTFGDMLNKVSSVQFNQSVESQLAMNGVKITPTTKRRKENYKFQKHCDTAVEYSYPSSFKLFQKEQQIAHYEGVKDAQTLFEMYAPGAAVEVLKEHNSWEQPYSFEFVDGVRFVSDDCPLPVNYNKLDKSFADLQNGTEAVDNHCLEDDLHNCYLVSSSDNNDSSISGISALDNDQGDPLENFSSECTSKWHITKLENGEMKSIHIKKALKLLLPREWISRNRGQRHIASKHLPGHAPVEPGHDVHKFCDVAVKVQVKETPCYQICKVVALRSKEGADIVSVNSKKGQDISFRYTLYSRVEGQYVIPSELPVSPWRSVSGILTVVEMKYCDKTFSLTEECVDWLSKKGYLPFEEVLQSIDSAGSDGSESSEERDHFTNEELEDDLGGGYYEVERIVDRRLNPSTQLFEYLVRFKGYSADHDMWLPASSFNMPVDYVSVSSYGRKRKSCTNVDESSGVPKRRLTNSSATTPMKSWEKSKKHGARSTEKKSKPAKISCCKKVDSDEWFETQRNDANLVNSHSISDITVVADEDIPLCVEGGNKDAHVKETLFREDLKERTTKFRSSRADIASHDLPPIKYVSQQDVTVEQGESGCCNPVNIPFLPPFSLYEDGAKALRKMVARGCSDYALKISSIGKFSLESLPVLHNYYVFWDIKKNFKVEKEFLERDASGISAKEKETLKMILYQRNPRGKFFAERNRIQLTIDQVTCLIGERYLNNNVINYLMNIFEKEGNLLLGRNACLAVDSLLLNCSKSTISQSIRRCCCGKDVTQLEIILIPTHLQHASHWGLAKIEVKTKAVFFDDGLHMRHPKELEMVVRIIINTLHILSSSDLFEIKAWEPLRFEPFGMPDQPSTGEGSSSCGVATLMAARNFFHGEPLTWTYEETSYFRRKFLLELIQDGQQRSACLN